MNKIITISREFGSGGREIGKRLADELGYAYYDVEVIKEISKEIGMSEEYINNISERGVYPIAFHFGKTFASLSSLQTKQTEIFVKQQEILKKIAKKGNAIIVGRGADVVLKDYKPINLFTYASMESKIKRCYKKATKDEILNDKEIEKKIKKVDNNRKKFHDILGNSNWGQKEYYDLCINTSNIEIKSIIKPLANYIQECFRRYK